MKTRLHPFLAAALLAPLLAIAQIPTPEPIATTIPNGTPTLALTPTPTSTPAPSPSPSPAPSPAAAATSPTPSSGNLLSPEAARWRERALTAAGRPGTTVVAAREKTAAVSVVRGPTVIEGVVEGDVRSVQGDVFVLGQVQGGVSSVAGDVYVLGEVRGPINIVAGKLFQAGRVNGPVNTVSGGTVSQWSQPGTSSPNSANRINFSLGDYSRDVAGNFFASVFGFFWRAGWAVLWTALALLVVALFPQFIERGVAFLPNQPGRTVAIGVVWKIAYWLLVLAFFIASFLLIGLPFLFAMLVAQWALVLVGFPILFLAVGRRVLTRVPWGVTSLYRAVLVGGAAFGVVRVIPLVGDVAWWLTGIFASGLALRYLFSLRPAVSPAPAAPLPPTAAA